MATSEPKFESGTRSVDYCAPDRPSCYPDRATLLARPKRRPQPQTSRTRPPAGQMRASIDCAILTSDTHEVLESSRAMPEHDIYLNRSGPLSFAQEAIWLNER